MPIDNLASGEPTEDDIYLAKLTMDEVGADIEEHGHVAVTSENCTQDPFTAKGSLANALDEAISGPSENIPEEKDPNGEGELHGEIEGVEMGNNPDTPTMDINNSKTTKDSLAAALDAVAMDARHTDTIESIKAEEVQENEIGDADTQMEDTDRQWLKQRDEAMKPELPKSLGNTAKVEDDGLVYLEYTFTIDPATYRSNNYQPIANAAEAGKNKNVSVESAKETESPEETEQIEVAEVEEKETEDEAPEKVALDYATCYDGSSFLCFDEVDGIDYAKVAMDASPKTPNMKPNCKTTFAQCRAKNPLYCRFHGPKLLEKDIKQALTALLGKNSCTISVTKDKDSKNPMTFRLTVGCVPAMKKKVEDMVHKFMTQNPGIKSSEDWKDLGEKGGKVMETEEFEMDILQADKPPKASDWALQAKYDTEKAKEAGKKQAVVGETPSNIEAIAKGEKPPMGDKGKKGSKPEEDDGSIGGIPAAQVDEAAQKLADSSIYWSDKNKTKKDFQEALKGDLVFTDTSFDEIKQVLGADNPIVGALVETAKHPNFKTDIPKYAQEFGEGGEDGEDGSGAEETKSDGTSGITEKDIAEAANKLASQPSQKMFYKDLIGKILNGESYLADGGLKQWAEDLGEDNPVYKAIAEASTKKLTEITDKAQALYNKPAGHKAKAKPTAIVEEDYQQQFADLADEAIDKKLFDDPDFKAKYDSIYHSGDEMAKQVENLSALVKEFSEKKQKGEQVYRTARDNVKKALSGTKYANAKLGIVKWDAEEEKPFKVAIDATYGDTLLAEMDKEGNIKNFAVYNPVDGWYGENPPEDLGKTIEEYEKSIKHSGEPDIEKQLSTLHNEFANDIGDSKGGSVGDSANQDPDELETEMDALYNKAKEKCPEDEEKIDEISIHFNLMKEEGNVDEMSQAIVDMKTLIGQKDKESSGSSSEPSTYDKDFGEAETAMKSLMDNATDYLAMGYMDVDEAHSNLITAFNDMKNTKGNIEVIHKAISFLDEEGDLSVSAVAKKKALKDGLKKFTDYWPQAVKKFNDAQDAMISAMNNAAGFDIDKMKAESAAKVEGIVRGVAKVLFPNGKTEGVESVVDLIEFKEAELNESASKNSISGEDLYGVKEKNNVFTTYNAAAKASHEFDAAVQQFKETIDEVKGADGKESLDEAAKEVSAKAVELESAFGAYKTAIEKAENEVAVWKQIQDLASPPKESEGNNVETPKSMKGNATFTDIAAKAIEKALNGTGYEFAKESFIYPIDGTIWTDNLLKDEFDKTLEVGYDPNTGKVSYLAAKADEGMNVSFASLGEAEKYLGIEKNSHPATSSSKKVYTKEMLDSMSPKDKLTAAISIAKKKLAANPSDEGLKAKLAKWEKQLASLG